jgi:hypothetical protein
LAKPETVSSLSVSRAAASSARHIDLACSPDTDEVGAPYTRLLRYEEPGWTAADLPQQAESLCQFRGRDGRTQLFVLSREAGLCAFDAGGAVSKIVDPALVGGAYRLGFLYSLFQVGGDLYAAGSGGQFYVLDGGGRWRALDTTLFDAPANPNLDWMDQFLQNPALLDDPNTNAHFMDQLHSDASTIFWRGAGAAPDSIYLAGERREGLAYFFNGARCEQIALPTVKPLRSVLVAPGGEVWMCSREGLLLKGRDRDFSVVADLGEKRRLASLAWFHDRLYLAASSGSVGLFVLSGDEVRPVRTGLRPEPTDIHTLQAVEGALWAVGMKALYRFGGERWERIAVPEIDL